MEVSKYFATLSFRTDVASLRRLDQQLIRQEKALQKQMLRMQKMMTNTMKGFVLPELKVKALSFDTLKMQRDSQTSLNRIGRLLELPIHNVRFDESKITRQLQGVLTRASNASRLNIRSIQGSSGGSNVYIPRPRATSQAQVIGNAAASAGMGSMGGLRNSLDHATSMMLPGRLAGLSGPALLAAAPFAAAYGVQRGSVSLGNEQAQREAQRTQLDVASGSSSRAARDKANKSFFDLSNKMGVEAEGLVDPYSKFLKQMLTMGRTYEQGFDLFKDMSIATRGAGGGQQQMERQAYALQQIIGLGHLRSEELNLQLADSNPAIKKYIMEAYSSRTGNTGVEAFQKALSKRQVSIEDVLKAYQNAAQAAGGRVEEFASTVQASQARLHNLKFAEQLDRTMSDDVIPAMKEYTEAQRELYEAMKPLRSATYEAAAGVLSFSAALIKGSAPYVNKIGNAMEGSPVLKSIAKNPLTYLPEINPVASAFKYSMIGYRAYQDSQSLPTATQAGADRFQSLQETLRPKLPTPIGILPKLNREDQFNSVLRQSASTINSTVTNQFSNTWEIHTSATDARTLATELEPRIKSLFNQHSKDQLGEALLQFGAKESN